MSINPLLSATKSNAFGDSFFSIINRNTFAEINANTLYKNSFILSEEEMCYLIAGTDSGLFVKYILTNHIPKNSKFIFIELDSVIDAMKIEIPKEYEGSVSIINITEFNKLESELSLYFQLARVTTVLSFGARDASFSEYITFNAQFFNIISSFKGIALSTLNHNFYKNEILSIADNNQPFTLIQNIFKNKTCVVVAAGPSFKQHLTWLKENQHHIVIIAIARICDNLVKAGITPHIICSLDPIHRNFMTSKEMYAYPNEGILVSATQTYPMCISQYNGVHLYTNDKYQWEPPVNETTEHGYTVSSFAISVGIKLGCTQILLMGLDLCYAVDGTSHTSGSKTYLALDNDSVWVTNNEGQLAETSAHLKLEIDFIEKFASINSNYSIINTAKAAAKMQSIEYKDIKDITFVKSNNILKLLHEKARFLNIDERITCLEKSKKDILLVIDKLKEKQLIINKAIALAAKYTESNFEDITNQLNIMEDELKKDRELAAFITNYGYIIFTKFFSFNMESETTANKIIKMQNYYNIYNSVIDSLIINFNYALNMISVRMDECSTSPNIDKMVAQWRMDKSLGRLNILKRFNPVAYNLIPNSTKTQLEKEFYDLLNPKQEELKIDLVALRKRINYLHAVKQSQLILPVIETTKEYAPDLTNYGRALVADLENNSDKVIYHLLDIKEHTEEDLRLLSKAALNNSNLELAMFAIKHIVHLSDQYLPIYASMLALSGDINNAINTYLDYLNVYNEDIVTWIKLADLLHKNQKSNDAINICNSILEHDPNNVTVKNKLLEISTSIH